MTRDTERSSLIYEQAAGYPLPPLAPIPAWGDLSSLREIGYAPGPMSDVVVRSILTLTGFRSFHRSLPEGLEDILRRYDSRGGYLFAPVTSATLVLENDPRSLTPAERAASLLFGAGSLYRDFHAGTLPPDRHNDHVLEMGQYHNLFSTSLVVGRRGGRLFKSTNTSTLIAILRGSMFAIDCGASIPEVSPAVLVSACEEVLHTPLPSNARIASPPAGLLSCARHETQCEIFRALQRDPNNAASLHRLHHSFLTVCFDVEESPSTPAEAAYLAHSVNVRNRWHHSSVQIVVFGNGRACMIFNFYAYLDGNTMVRAAAEIQRRAMTCDGVRGGEKGGHALIPVIPLQWNIPPAWIERAEKEVQKVRDDQQATYELAGYGAHLFRSHGISPVPAFVVALAMTLRRVCGRTVPITQFVSMSAYRCMDVTTAEVLTPEVLRCIELLEGKRGDRGSIYRSLKDAVESHDRSCKAARRVFPLWDLFGLFLESRTSLHRLCGFLLAHVGLIFLGVVGRQKLRQNREVIISHPEVYPEVLVVGRPGIRLPYVTSLGLHYQMFPEKTVVTLMPGSAWTVSNEVFVGELRDVLAGLRKVLEEDIPGSPAHR